MERLLIILAVLVCIAAGVAVAAISARSRRPPLRMDGEIDEADEDLLIGTLGAPASPIDRSAQVLDMQVLDMQALDRQVPDTQALDTRMRDARRLDAPAHDPPAADPPAAGGDAPGEAGRPGGAR